MKNQWKTLFLLSAALAVVVLYALSKEEISFDVHLQKANISNFLGAHSEDSLLEAERLAAYEDSVRRAREHPDTTKQRILFFGDSMIEGLMRRMADYSEHNGHSLHSVVWYSSTSEIWAKTDTLEHFLREDKPTYAIVCLCANELFVKDLDQREQYIKTILRKLDGIPYVWVSPPNWKDDTGINELIIKNVGKDRYFDSRHLTLERGRDHAHPTFSAAVVWADTIASWLRSKNTVHPICMDIPTSKAAHQNITLLMPYKP